MIRGSVSAHREAIVPLVVRGGDGIIESVRFAVDTGFTGFVTLPAEVVRRLELRRAGTQRTLLADGVEVTLRKFLAWVRWGGAERETYVLEAEGEPVLGMSMLDGHQLVIEVRTGGKVEISPLS